MAVVEMRTQLVECVDVAFVQVTLHLPISLHSFGTGSPPRWSGGALDSQPRPHTPAVKADWLAVLSVRSRGRPLVSTEPSPTPQFCFLVVVADIGLRAEGAEVAPPLQTISVTQASADTEIRRICVVTGDRTSDVN